MSMNLRSMGASLSVLALLAAGASMASCSTEEADPEQEGTGGSEEQGTGGVEGSGDAGAPSTGGAEQATGGTSGTETGGAASTDECNCTPQECDALKPLSATILDFESCGDDPTQCQFGAYAPGELNGGTFTYPLTADPCAEDQTPPAYPIPSDFSEGNWHITGTVGTYSGFGLWFGPCPLADLSDYAGVSFTVAGDVGPTGTMTFRVSTASNTLAKVSPAVECYPNSATCTATTCNADSNYTVTVTEETTTVEVRWEDLTGGAPSSNPIPTEITSFGFYFDYVGSEFPVDLVVDDLALIPAG